MVPFSFAHAPSLLHGAPHDLRDKTVGVYLDDIVVFSKSVEEHEKHLGEVLNRLRRYRPYTNKGRREF